MLLGACVTGFQSGGEVVVRAATDGGPPPIVNATVPFAILMVIGLVISRTFKSD